MNADTDPMNDDDDLKTYIINFAAIMWRYNVHHAEIAILCKHAVTVDFGDKIIQYRRREPECDCDSFEVRVPYAKS